MKSDLPFTGERFVPGAQGEIWVEHWHRYHFASRWVAARRVLDVACGEGYGAALLARTAAHVTGVDISSQAIGHARAAYASMPNVEFICASCTELPLADASVDVAVTFETIEHIGEQSRFLDELARVLAPDGVLILSCPNKLEYSDKRDFANEFHVKELYRGELEKLVAVRFPESDWYGQRPTFFSLIAPELPLIPAFSLKGEGALLPLPSGRGPGRGSVEAQMIEVTESSPDQASSHLENPLYFVVIASRAREALAAVPPALSVLSDRDDWVHRDYEKVMRYLQNSAKQAEGLQQQLEQRDEALSELNDQVRDLQTAVSVQDAALSEQKALVDATTAAHQAQIAAKDGEIDRRRSWRWWLRLPFIRIGLLK